MGMLLRRHRVVVEPVTTPPVEQVEPEVPVEVTAPVEKPTRKYTKKTE